MEKEDQQKIIQICELLKIADQVEDFITIQGLISNIFSDKTSKNIDSMLLGVNNFYITAFENVFNNKAFIEAVGKVLEQHKNFQKNYKPIPGKTFTMALGELEIKNKKLIFISLSTALMVLSNVLENLDKTRISNVAASLKSCIRRFKNTLNEQYSSLEILPVLLGTFSKKFYPKVKFIKIKKLDHLFLNQKISSHLMILSLVLSFKHSYLSSLFASIEKGKSEGKFSSGTINRLSDFVKSTRNREEYLKNLVPSLLKGFRHIQDFTEPFKDTRNEENAFNLIEITLREFKSYTTSGPDIIKTINTAHDIVSDLKKYASISFEAYSGNITLGSHEWSNKIFINCCKFLGAMEGLSGAVDSGWKIDVCVKEFADWTSSINKILNKYDLEDDWSNVGKYLNQETNKVEWKGTFFTPINTNKLDPKYQNIGKDIFYSIVKTLIGMINTDGGVILIGLVEKPEDVINEELKGKLLEKNGKTFLDVSEELNLAKIDLDGVKRKIQDLLQKETLVSIDNFNNLWRMEEISIKSKDGEQSINVYMIEVLRSDKPIFSVKFDGELDGTGINVDKSEVIWISLLKRADARTIRIDPRRHLTV
ncbi:MAG: hypothetical protein HYT64_00740 [Candidatus Yanofskybacteria bacterium]|nr:hypothetical protein [Candidatus Yanofskybacteria bacterium]